MPRSQGAMLPVDWIIVPSCGVGAAAAAWSLRARFCMFRSLYATEHLSFKALSARTQLGFVSLRIFGAKLKLIWGFRI